jgi:hypothetical protein
MAQPAGDANGAPAPLTRNGAPGADYGAPPPQGPSAQAGQDRDLFCRRDAAQRTGFTTPDQAARDEQARGSIGGTLGGAALGAVIGGASGNAGAGAAIGAGAGLIAGTAVGADNANRAARDVQADYAAAYYACMGVAQDGSAPQGQYADADYPPPPPGYAYGYPYPYPYHTPYPYYGPYPYYYGGPVVGFGFGGGFRGGFHGGGFRHR